MREKLNENPMAQVGLIVGLLVVVAVVIFISSSGGEEEEARRRPKRRSPSPARSGGTATGATPAKRSKARSKAHRRAVAEAGVAAAPSLGADPAAATAGDRRLRRGQDRRPADRPRRRHRRRAGHAASSQLLAASTTSPSSSCRRTQIARYAAITVGLDVNRVPALVVMKPEAAQRRHAPGQRRLRLPDPAERRAGGPGRRLRRPRSHLPPELSRPDERREPPYPQATCARSPTREAPPRRRCRAPRRAARWA